MTDKLNALISNTKGEGKEGDPFWTKAETLLYCALLGYIIFEGAEEDRNMNTLVDMISGMEVKEDDEDFLNAVDYMFKGLEQRKPNCFAVKQYKKYKLSSGKTAKSILISCGARLAPFDIPQLREIMSYDELELDRMGDRRTATFFCISDTDSTYNFLVALAFSQMFNLLCERADNVHGGRLPHHVRVLWDEAANTGQVPNLEKLVAVIRSREISLCLLYQQLAQCKAIYDKSAETILGKLRRYAEQAGYTIVGVAAEHGSGLTLDRPALQELTEAVLAGKVDVVLVNSLDRLGRDWGMTKQYIDLLTEHKVKLLCVRERMMIDSSSFSPFFT